MKMGGVGETQLSTDRPFSYSSSWEDG